jgi:hypothetical protein
MADNKIDYRQMYSNRRRKSRTPERAPKPAKTTSDLGLFKPVREKAPERPLNENTRDYRIKEMLFADPNLTVDEIAKRMGTTSRSAKFSITHLRDAYLHTIRFLVRKGATGLRAPDHRAHRQTRDT